MILKGTGVTKRYSKEGFLEHTVILQAKKKFPPGELQDNVITEEGDYARAR